MDVDVVLGQDSLMMGPFRLCFDGHCRKLLDSDKKQVQTLCLTFTNRTSNVVFLD